MMKDGVNSERRRFLTTTASVVGGAGALATQCAVCVYIDAKRQGQSNRRPG